MPAAWCRVLAGLMFISVESEPSRTCVPEEMCDSVDTAAASHVRKRCRDGCKVPTRACGRSGNVLQM